jgi:hypothetical protein
MVWRPGADHGQKHEPGDATITQGIDTQWPITEELFLLSRNQLSSLLGRIFDGEPDPPHRKMLWRIVRTQRVAPNDALS